MLDYKIPNIKKILFQTCLEVRINDVHFDHLGHHALLSLIHEARVQFLKKFGYSEISVHGVGMVATGVMINYINQAFYADKLIIELGIEDFSKTSVEFIFRVVNQENKKEIARALTRMTFYDRQKKRVAKIPQEFLLAVGV